MTQTSEARRVVQEAIEKLGGLDLILANAVRWNHLWGAGLVC